MMQKFFQNPHVEAPKPKQASYPTMAMDVSGCGKQHGARFIVRVQGHFRPNKFTVDEAIAPFFLIHDVRIHRHTIFRTADPMLATSFTDARRVAFDFETAPVGSELYVECSRRPVWIVCQANGRELPDVSEMPEQLKALHPHASRHTGAIDLLWDGWPIPDWVDARVSDHYDALADNGAKRAKLFRELEEMLTSPARGAANTTNIIEKLHTLIALEKQRDVLADYAGEPFRATLEFRSWFEGLEISG